MSSLRFRCGRGAPGALPRGAPGSGSPIDRGDRLNNWSDQLHRRARRTTHRRVPALPGSSSSTASQRAARCRVAAVSTAGHGSLPPPLPHVNLTALASVQRPPLPGGAPPMGTLLHVHARVAVWSPAPGGRPPRHPRRRAALWAVNGSPPPAGGHQCPPPLPPPAYAAVPGAVSASLPAYTDPLCSLPQTATAAGGMGRGGTPRPPPAPPTTHLASVPTRLV